MGKTKGKFSRKLLQITIGPLVLAGILVLLITYIGISATIQKEVRRGLRNIAIVTQRLVDHSYVGDYYLEQSDGSYNIYKGSTNITGNDHILQEIKRDTGVDVTFFYGDIRVLTTLKYEDGSSFVGTTAHSDVVEDVLDEGREMFYRKILVGEKPYFAYYTPLYNGDGTRIGMVFAGKPTNVVNSEIAHTLFPIFLLLLLVGTGACIICIGFAKEVIFSFSQIKTLLREIAQGNLNAELDEQIVDRNDELGEMGRFVVHVQKFLCEMIEKDMLTKLYSRRIGETKLKQVQADSIKYEKDFCVALGDIDFFKKFNDMYGHDCGDRVLKEISALISKNMSGKGFAVRWGGEEVLIIYENASLKEAKAYLEIMREEIIRYKLRYNEQNLSITMTFGIVEGTKIHDIAQSIKQADDLLYQGKTNGRNQIVTPLLEG